MKQILIVLISTLLYSCTCHKKIVKDYTNPRFSYKGEEEEVICVEESLKKDNLLSLYVSDKSINCSTLFEGYVRCKVAIELDSLGNVRRTFIKEQIPQNKEIGECITKAIYSARFIPAQKNLKSIPSTFNVLLYIDLYNSY